jgi:hypothetical protein
MSARARRVGLPSPRHVVVDGSNLATEGRAVPSFDALREAVDAFRAENPGVIVTVVVDASFVHRVDASERSAVEAAEASGEVVSPPAGAIGRGDGFLLQIADRTGATVLSNDSFQEFHDQHEWLFEPGRLVGGKPVAGVGWIFSLRSPVREAKTRRARPAGRTADAQAVVRQAIVEATQDALEPGSPRARARRRRRRGPPPGAVNDPDPFLMFVANHPLGSEFVGHVERFTSHGAFVSADAVSCYVPLSGLGHPPPRRARDVLRRGDLHSFVVQAIDAPRRGIEVALPEHARIAGQPCEETVEAEVKVAAPKKRVSKAQAPPAKTAGAKRSPARRRSRPASRAG